MGLSEAVKSVFSKYATFQGRASRSEYWYFYLFNILLEIGLLIVGFILGAILGDSAGAFAGMVAPTYCFVSMVLLSLFLTFPYLCAVCTI